jgi:hypothetical protein
MGRHKENGKSPLIAFRSKKVKLTNKQAQILLEKGAKLFELMDTTEEAKRYLEFEPDLQEAIDAW